ncbi:hypothetical protein E1B28_003801 [Marasmius oreades]|uniref:Sulfotransferase n=1 Tax=Marasmius oreades TaxID=181124 RepID=A0A9P8ABG4_9AGAR|nr:uncharacterized protein E1B28_003801 [Marasmius oreades]KAG7096357.1 hypothetical protein E1B28_003801 [Marasmius oreades]
MAHQRNDRRLRLFLFSHPRTTSNLFMRLLEGLPNIAQSKYLYFPPYFYGPDRQAGCPREEYHYMPGYDRWEERSYQNTFDAMQKFMKDAEDQGKIPLVMDHALMLTTPTVPRQTIPEKPEIVDRMLDYDVDGGARRSPPPKELPIPNPTFFPDAFLLTLTPLFIIRHPARTFPSYLRAISANATPKRKVFDEETPVAGAFKNQILVFDFFRALNGGQVPVVVEGERLVKDTKEQMKKVCEKIGLKEEDIKYEWQSKNIKLPQVMEAFQGKVLRSTGVMDDGSYDRPVDISEEAKKWEKEWDADVAKRMEELVRASVKDYEYLLQFAL